MSCIICGEDREACASGSPAGRLHGLLSKNAPITLASAPVARNRARIGISNIAVSPNCGFSARVKFKRLFKVMAKRGQGGFAHFRNVRLCGHIRIRAALRGHTALTYRASSSTTFAFQDVVQIDPAET